MTFYSKDYSEGFCKELWLSKELTSNKINQGNMLFVLIEEMKNRVSFLQRGRHTWNFLNNFVPQRTKTFTFSHYISALPINSHSRENWKQIFILPPVYKRSNNTVEAYCCCSLNVVTHTHLNKKLSFFLLYLGIKNIKTLHVNL